ncbi:MAG: flagella accessory protein C [Candidatus Thermoplasmatota archaeon]|nr:flagella accessory protein C [Candidatus Thermoplasmatota archaeon]
MKLKMGKGENGLAEQLDEGNSEPVTEPTPKEPEEKIKKSEDEKADTDSIRKVIKLDSPKETATEAEKSEASDEKSEEVPKEKDTSGSAPDLTTGKSPEQNVAVLQGMKDFDFQIKKNQGGITDINQKLDSVTRDLDDLVSLYEIVSEQMNPFVGLSKVTKKRIDALENFTREVETLKSRVGDMESFAERVGANLNENQEQISTLSNKEHSKNVSEEVMGKNDIDSIVEESLNALTSEEKVDLIIDEFIENLK